MVLGFFTWLKFFSYFLKGITDCSKQNSLHILWSFRPTCSDVWVMLCDSDLYKAQRAEPSSLWALEIPTEALNAGFSLPQQTYVNTQMVTPPEFSHRHLLDIFKQKMFFVSSDLLLTQVFQAI